MPLPYYREVFTEHEKGEPLTLLFLQVSLELLEGHLHNHVGLTENFDQSENEEFLVNDSP